MPNPSVSVRPERAKRDPRAPGALVSSVSVSRVAAALFLLTLALLPWAAIPRFPWLHENAQWSDAVFALAVLAWGAGTVVSGPLPPRRRGGGRGRPPLLFRHHPPPRGHLWRPAAGAARARTGGLPSPQPARQLLRVRLRGRGPGGCGAAARAAPDYPGRSRGDGRAHVLARGLRVRARGRDPRRGDPRGAAHRPCPRRDCRARHRGADGPQRHPRPRPALDAAAPGRTVAPPDLRRHVVRHASLSPPRRHRPRHLAPAAGRARRRRAPDAAQRRRDTRPARARGARPRPPRAVARPRAPDRPCDVGHAGGARARPAPPGRGGVPARGGGGRA